MFASLRTFYIVVGSLVLAGVILWSLYSFFKYPIEHIEIFASIENNKDADKIDAILKNTLHKSWLLLAVEDVEKMIEKLDWVQEVSISKSNLGELSVDITLKTPMFRWKTGYLLSNQAALIVVDDQSWNEYSALVQVESSTKNLIFLKGIEDSIVELEKNKMSDLQKIRIGLYQEMELIFAQYTLVVDAPQANESLLRFAGWMKELPKNIINSQSRIDLRYVDGFAVSQP